MKTKKLTVLALSISLALILSYVESLLPAFVAIPGIKMGLANIVIVFVLYKLGWKEAVLVSIIRVILVSLLFGSIMSLFYSFAGALLSLVGMIFLKKTDKFSTIAVSVTGGVLHNIGQIVMAGILLETNVLLYYLPFLLFSGIVSGILIGILAATMVKRIHLDL